MAESLCPQCASPNRNSARYCANCGAPLISGIPTLQPGAAGAPSGASDFSNSAPLESGIVLQGRYQIEHLLGKGGFGAVYRAWDSNLKRPCAVKENLDASPEAQRQFSREASVLAGLSHPNLPRVTDHFSISGQGQYLVMDFVEGDDMATLLQRQGMLPAEQVLTWISQVMDALTYLHNRQPPVVHRDLKPANIRITPEGKAMLVDFGLVKLYSPHLKTTMGARAVTPGYSPPEQYGQGTTDTRTDVYALGATLYVLLTGQDPPESVLRIGQDVLVPVHQVNPQISPAIGRVIGQAMALSPSQRYQTITNLKDGLNAAFSAPVEQPVLPTVVVSTLPQSKPVESNIPRTVKESGVEIRPISRPADIHRPVVSAAKPAKLNWLVWVGGIGVAVAILALILGYMAWNSMENAAVERRRQTVEAGVEATKTARAEATATAQGSLLPASTPVPSQVKYAQMVSPEQLHSAAPTYGNWPGSSQRVAIPPGR